jgi:hypothetical protein
MKFKLLSIASNRRADTNKMVVLYQLPRHRYLPLIAGCV